MIVDTIDEIIELSKTRDVVVIGGAMLYEKLFRHADEVFLTLVYDYAPESDVDIRDLHGHLKYNFDLVSDDKITAFDKKSKMDYEVSFRTYKR